MANAKERAKPSKTTIFEEDILVIPAGTTGILTDDQSLEISLRFADEKNHTEAENRWLLECEDALNRRLHDLGRVAHELMVFGSSVFRLE